MPTRTGYTDSTYHLDTPWSQDDSNHNDYIYGDSNYILIKNNEIVESLYNVGDSNYVAFQSHSLTDSGNPIDSDYFKNYVLIDTHILNSPINEVATAQNNADSANNLVATLRVQLANAESGSNPAIQTWSS
tara:strand:- start:915 stop:1307 length:393 start_codon:yes stop_codon:yes gene_type:complete